MFILADIFAFSKCIFSELLDFFSGFRYPQIKKGGGTLYTIHYCEAGRQNPDGDRIFRPNGSGDWLFLLFLSPMTVVLPSGTQTAQSGACILYPPDACQDYFAPGVFLNSYIHFSAPEPSIYTLPTCTLFYPSDPQHIDHVLAQIQAECLTKDMWFDEMSDTLLRGLFLSLSREQTTAKTPISPLFEPFRQARLAILSRCEEPWNAEQMCALVNLSKSQFYAYYRAFFGVSPKEDLISARLNRACNLLTNQLLSVSEAAAQCGFMNLCHFTRLFKRRFGCSPGAYQKMHRHP